ncbi:hypothetical protein Tco_1279686 [Tanacetum coccineum]
MIKGLQERGFGSLPGSTEINPRDHVKSISTTVDADMKIRRIGLSRYAVSDLQDSMMFSVPNQMTIPFPCRLYHCDKEKGSYGLKDMDAYSIGTTLCNDALPQKGKRPRDLREWTELDFEARLIGETLILNRSLDPSNEDYIELNDLNEPLELRRNQANDLKPTIEEGEVDDEPIKDIDKARCNDEIIGGLDENSSFCDLDRKIHIDCAFNLKFSCMIGYEHVDANFLHLFSINVMSKIFYNLIMKDKMEFKGKNIVGTFINMPIFVGNFFVMTNFIVVEDMDNYRDDGMGNVIVGKPFCREVFVKTKRFEGMITIFNSSDNVTYPMVRSHLRFKHLTEEQCNKIPLLLKVSEQDKMNGILHSYQKLKGFY